MFYPGSLTTSTYINRPRQFLYGSARPMSLTHSYVQPRISFGAVNRPQLPFVYQNNTIQPQPLSYCNRTLQTLPRNTLLGSNTFRFQNQVPVPQVNHFASPQIRRTNPFAGSMIFQSQPAVINYVNANDKFTAAINKTNETIQNTIQKFSPEKASIPSTAQKLEGQFNSAVGQTDAQPIVENFDQLQANKEQINNGNQENDNAEIHILRYEDGFVYEGSAFESQRSGFGVLKNQDGMIVYLGNWKNDSFHGEGELRNISVEQFSHPFDYADFGELGDKWQKYEGEFLENAFFGKGELVLTNGEKFVGQFEEGRIQGEGIFYTLAGEIISGVWNDNILEKRFG